MNEEVKINRTCQLATAPASKRFVQLAAMVAMLLGGCTLPPRHEAPPLPRIPAQWSQVEAVAGAADGAPARPWWLAIGDERLTELINLALRTNRDVARTASLWQQAVVQTRISELDSWPQPSLELNGDAQRSLNASGGVEAIVINGVSVPVPSAPTVSKSFGGAASLSYEIDLWSRISLNQAQAQNNAAAAAADIEAARWLVTTKVAEQYWTLASLDAKVDLAQDSVVDAQNSLAAAHLQLDVGKVRLADVDKANVALQAARTQIVALETQRQSAVQSLALWLDVPPEQFAAPAASLPVQDPSLAPTTSPANVLDRRPDLRSARLKLDAALRAVDIAEADRYPQLTLSANVGSGGDALARILSNPVGTLGASLAIPLVDWSRMQARRDLVSLQLDEAAIAFRDTLYRAFAEVESAFTQRRQVAAELRAARSKERVAEAAAVAARLRYDSGADPMQAVRDAAQAQRDAAAALIDVRLRGWLNRIAIDKALGGPIGAPGGT